MTNATLRANAQAMPNRRAALGVIAAAGAMLAAPLAAKAAGPDAALFELARRARALSLEGDAADMAWNKLEDDFELPPPPACLLIRAGDEAFTGEKDGAFASMIGEPLTEKQLTAARYMRTVYQNLSGPLFGDLVNSRAMEMLTRVTEIDFAAEKYLADIEAAKVAAGIRDAEAKAAALHDATLQAYRALAFTPARTVEGVLAKLDAVSDCYGRKNPAWYPDGCRANIVVDMAIVELTDIRTAKEA